MTPCFIQWNGCIPRTTLVNSAATIAGPRAQGQQDRAAGTLETAFRVLSAAGDWYPRSVAAPRAARGATAWLSAWAGLWLVAGCGQLGSEERFEPQVGAIEIVETIPSNGSSGADPVGSIDLCLSAEADPRAVQQLATTLHSGHLFFDTETQVQLFSWRAPGSRGELAVDRWCPGSVISVVPGGAIQAGLIFRLQVREISGLGWAGERLDTDGPEWAVDPDDGELRMFLEFQVGGTPGDPDPEEIPSLPPGPTLDELFTDERVFDPERAACSCHQSDEDPIAIARLDLRDPDAAYAGLVLRDGTEATGFPMVSPRLPSESYLLHKLIRTDGGDALHGILGDPMPPAGPLPHTDLVDLAHWIADGAQR